MTRTTRTFSAVKTEGGLLPQDILSRIQSGDPDLPGTSPETYNLAPHERIGEAANRAWSRLGTIWHAFQEALEKEPEDSPATGLTRDRWLLPLFQELGYGRLPKGASLEAEGKSFAISHTWNHSPIHLLGCRVDLDRRQKGVAGAAKSSPHGLVQEFLNRSEDHLWGFVTNGYRLRVLRDHHSLTRQSYVEFDLQTILDGEQYSEFLLLWLVCHQSRVEAEQPEACWLETWANTSRDEGVRALDKLRGGVEKAIEALGTGFLSHPANTALRAALESGKLDKQDYYRQLLRLVYRLIFLFVAEERGALLDPNALEEARARYSRWYDTHRLRLLAEKRRGSPHGDVWRGLALVMENLYAGYPALGLPALGSRLWGAAACPALMQAQCANEHVLTAIRQLSHIQEGATRYPVNWRNIGADELGSIYEGLLELHPRVNREAGGFSLDTAAGHERKTTGSYYTPTALVDCLLEASLDPLLDEASKQPDPEHAILDLKVCDPACGSGHFLVAAARRIAGRLAAVRSGDDEPSPEEVQRALRDVVGRCVYGVDLNPMAVELCKVSLWMEAIEPGRPLSFLDGHIQCGNALLGATPEAMSQGIPDVVFKPTKGEVDYDESVAKRLVARNRDERRGQGTMFSGIADTFAIGDDQWVKQADALESISDDSIGAVEFKEGAWRKLIDDENRREAWFAADAWCAAHFWPKRPGKAEQAAPTHGTWVRIRDGAATDFLVKSEVQSVADRLGFFHWHLAFPHIFRSERGKVDSSTGAHGGFDAIVGNPPFQDSESMKREDPLERRFLTQVFESAAGNWDRFVPFVERALQVTRHSGWHAFVTPNKLLGADYAAIIQSILLRNRVAEVHDFSELSLFRDASVAVVIVACQKIKAESDSECRFVMHGVGESIIRSCTATLGELRALPPGYISFPLTCEDPELIAVFRDHDPLQSVALISDGASTCEAYAIKPLVRELPESRNGAVEPGELRLVNTGTIDPFKLDWGQQPITYLGFKGLRPVVSAAALGRVAPKRLEQALTAKVVVAGLSKRLEAAVAPSGVLCGKSAIQILPMAGICPYAIAAALNSSVVDRLYRGMFSMRGMGRGTLNVGARQLERVPVPPRQYFAALQRDGDEVLHECRQLLERRGDCSPHTELAHEVLSYLGQRLVGLAESEESAEEALECQQLCDLWIAYLCGASGLVSQ